LPFVAILQYNQIMKFDVYIRLYEELNVFLEPFRQKKDFNVQIESNTLIHNLLEKLKIPLSQVDLILVNGESVDFDVQLHDGDRISVYPVFETLNIDSITRLRKKSLRHLRFICDVHLGKLAKYMRMCGFDVFYSNNLLDHLIIQMSDETKSIILTKNKELFKTKQPSRAYLVKQSDSKMQLFEIISYFDLKTSIEPFSRCTKCNLTVQPVDKNSIEKQVPSPVLKMHKSFMKCYGCNRIYWQGSHYMSMLSWISRI
jgi:uncharacterized protein